MRQEEGVTRDSMWRGISALTLLQLDSIAQLHLGGAAAFTELIHVQGYLAHENLPPPLGPP